MRKIFIASVMILVCFNIGTAQIEKDTIDEIFIESDIEMEVELSDEELRIPPPPPPPPPPVICDGITRIQEDMPRFPGCNEGSKDDKKICADKKMLTFIYKNQVYPKKAKEKNIEGTVVISFIVTETGTIENAKIVREIGGGCGEEALRIVNSMPDWVPGIQRGKPVKVQFNLPIKFTQGGKKKKKRKRRFSF